jgi:hypothetical protein
MINPQVKTSELILSGSQPGGLVIKLISPVQINTDPAGKTFLFGIIQSGNSRIFKIVSDVIEYLEDPENIAEAQKKYSRFSSPQTAVETQLESILKTINTKINSFFTEKELESIYNGTSILIALQNENALSLAGRGDICAMILRLKKKQIGLNLQDTYEVLDLIKKSEENSRAEVTEGLFPNFLSGRMNNNDALMISTENLWKKICEENLIRGTAALPPQSAIEFLKNKIGRWNDAGAAAFILKLTGVEDEAHAAIKEAAPVRPPIRYGNFFKNSMDELQSVEKKTENVFSHPNLFKKYSESFNNFFSSPSSNLNGSFSSSDKPDSPRMVRAVPPKIPPRRIAGNSQRFPFGTGGSSVYKNLRAFFELAFRAAGTAVVIFFKTLYRLFYVATNFKGVREKAGRDIKNDFKNNWDKIILWFNGLPKKSKYLFISGAFLIFIFSQSVFFFTIKQSDAKEKEIYNLAIQDIKSMAESAEASLIYGDSKKAENILTDAETKIAGLAQKTKNEKKQVAYLKQILNDKLLKIFAVIDVAEPRLIADLGNAGGEYLGQSGKEIYILSPASASILKLDPETGKVNPFITFENSGATPENWMQTGTQKLTIWKNTITGISALAEINLKDKKISPLSFETGEQIKDFKIYNNKIYALDSFRQQIVKHNGATGGFGKGGNWTKDGQAELANAFAMAMDGAIYVLKHDGNIVKYYAGNITGFYAHIPKVIGQEELKLEKAKIWTSDEAKYIYVLDQTNNRILAFDKNGVLKGQYTSPAFKNLKDFVINEAEHKIFVLSDTQVLGIIASHIESN